MSTSFFSIWSSPAGIWIRNLANGRRSLNH